MPTVNSPLSYKSSENSNSLIGDTFNVSVLFGTLDNRSDASADSASSAIDSSVFSTVSESHSHSHGSYDSHHGPEYYGGGYHRESSASGTGLSPNNSGYTGDSNSHGTSERSGKASKLSSVSIKFKPNLRYFDNGSSLSDQTDDSSEATTVEILAAPGGIGGIDEIDECCLGRKPSRSSTRWC